MSTAIKVATNPSTEPVSLAETIKYARGNVGLEDDVFDDLIKCATEQVELITQHRLITHTTEQWFNCFPDSRRFDLMYPPLVTINSLKYYDEDGTQQTWAASNYWTQNNSNHQSWLEVKPTSTIPNLENGRPQAIVINYDNGYGTAATDVPETYRQVIKMFVNDLYYARRMNMEQVQLTENKTAMQLLGSLAVQDVDVITIANITTVSGGAVI